MRITLLLTAVLVAAGSMASAAMPYFHANNAPDAQAYATGPQQKGGWKFPSLWPKAQPAAQDPQFIYQAPVAAPSATQRFGQALTNNRLTNTVGGWITPNDSSSPRNVTQQRATVHPDDALSMSRPVEEPTPKLLVAMAQVREAQGDIEGARGMYLKALASGPKDANALRELGHFEDRQGRLADAEKHYQQAVAVAPQDTGALNDLALCLARQGKLNPAAEVLHRAIRIAPGKPLYRNNMATVLMELGEQQDAMLHLMAAHPPAAAFYNMGHLLEKGGKLPAAAAHYAEATRLDPSMKLAQEAVARTSPAPVPQQVAVPPQVAVPQTALAPRSAPIAQQAPTVSPEPTWPSEPIAVPPTREPTFGPKLLPPTE